MDGAWLTYDSFAPLVGSAFVASADGGPVELSLVEATDTGTAGGVSLQGQSRTQFVLEFRGPATSPLAQGTYELRNDALGTVPIFFVPVRSDADACYYEAVFA